MNILGSEHNILKMMHSRNDILITYWSKCASLSMLDIVLNDFLSFCSTIDAPDPAEMKRLQARERQRKRREMLNDNSGKLYEIRKKDTGKQTIPEREPSNIKGKGPDGTWTRKPLAYRKSYILIYL